MTRRIGHANRQIERALMEALQVRLSAQVQRAMARTLAADYSALAGGYERYGAVDESLVDGRTTGRVIRAGWQVTGEAFSQRFLGQLPKGRKDLFTDMFADAFATWAEQWIAEKVTRVTRTTIEQVREVVLRGEAEGLGVDEIARQMRKTIPDFSRQRSHVIARTETHFAAGFANQASAEMSGLDLRREWCASGDERTRESHAEADGQIVEAGQPFEVGDSLLDYPGDAAGPAHEVIMCFPANTAVLGGATGAYRRWYEGELVEIKTQRLRVAGTPKHPMLTARGWVALEDIGEGDRIFGVSDSWYGKPRRPQDKRTGRGFTIGQAFQSFAHTMGIKRIAASAVNYHGERPDDDVDFTDASQWIDEVLGTDPTEQTVEQRLIRILWLMLGGQGTGIAPGSIGAGDQLAPFLGAGLAHPQGLGLRSRSRLDAMMPEPDSDLAATCAQLIGDGISTKARFVKAYRLLAEKFGANLFDAGTGVVQSFVDKRDAASEFACYLGNILGFNIQLHDVVSSERKAFAGHVFNLETPTGVYLAGGMVAHNCRCQALYLAD